MPPSYPRTSRITFTILSADTQTAVASPLDIGEGNTLVGILCPSSLGSSASMTFDGSLGTVATRTSAEPAAPTVSGDYFDLKDQANAELISITLAAGDAHIFDSATSAKAANLPRWLRPTLNTSPGADLTFTAIVRVY